MFRIKMELLNGKKFEKKYLNIGINSKPVQILKDGPSAGIKYLTSIVSSITKIPVKKKLQ